MAKAKTKTRGANLPVPQNRDEAAAAVRRVGENNRSIARLEADMNDRLAAIKEEFEQAAGPLRECVEADTEGLKIWAEANRSSLTAGGKTKTADLGTGEIKWRTRPAKVTIRAVEDVLKRLRSLGLKRFIRTKEEVDREAMLREPAVAGKVPGVTIGSEGEDFVVGPFEAELSGQVVKA